MKDEYFEFNQIVQETLFAIYSNDLFSKDLYLKGGQALRLGDKILSD